jgi:hypothetical protein
VLLNCANVAIGDSSCEWYVPPAQPKTKAAALQKRHFSRQAERMLAARRLTAPECSLVGDTQSCSAYADRP